MPTGRIYGSPMSWHKLCASWSGLRAKALRKDAGKVRCSYTRPEIVAVMDRYAMALDRAAEIMEQAHEEFAREHAQELSNG